MGTWDTGPFDNDLAADWCAELDEADPAARLAMIRSTLAEAADGDGPEEAESVRAIAAAAVVVSQAPGAPPLTSAYAPEFLVEGGAVAVPGDVAVLAVRALDRILADGSPWREWSESGDAEEAFAVVAQLRAALAGVEG